MAYRAQKASLMYPFLATQIVLRRLAGIKPRADARQEALIVHQRYLDLLRLDLQNVEDGLYPESLLFSAPIWDYAKNMPRFLQDVPKVVQRWRRNNFQDLPDTVDLNAYPHYFRRNFHWQSDGYLSRHSAMLYDFSVDVLFLGAADIMRRQIIPPITRYLEHQPPRQRILDVGAGTGRTLLQLCKAHPGHEYFALDLSPFYLQEARHQLSHLPQVSFVRDNAELMPFKDASFRINTSVFLFHELPRAARRTVLREMYRVLQPGGLAVILDSAQLAESPELAQTLNQFAQDFHEPFYRDYIKDDLHAALTDVGFHVQNVSSCLVAKLVVARKPD